MKDSPDKPLFDDEELAGTTPDDESTDKAAAGNESTDDSTSVAETDESTDTSGNGTTPELDESKLQAIADQLASLDDEAMAAAVRGMPDESRQALCSAVAATLSDEQLGQCGLSKGTAMAMDEDEAQLQEDMAVARPEQTGSTFMSLNNTKKTGEVHPHSLKLAEMMGKELLSRARVVHSKNPAVITAEQIENIEAKLQGQKCMSLLEPDHGDLQPITVLVSMGERMVKGDNDSDLLEVKTLNMSLTGVAEGGQPRAVKVPAQNSSGFNEAEATQFAAERWKTLDKTTPAMNG